MTDPPGTRYADVGDSQVAYQVFGDGPDLVFSIGFFLGHVDHLWELPAMVRFLRRLASFSRVIMFDRRGTGASDSLPPTHGSSFWENWVDDLDAVLNAVGAERPSLLGSADAGPMAIQFAATYPERVASLILTNTGARVAPAPDDPYGVPAEVWGAVERRLGEEWGKEDSQFVDLLWPERATDLEIRRWVSKVQRSVMTPKRAVELWRMLRDIDVRSSLPLIQAPTLVLTGSDWTLVPVLNSEHLAKEIRGARLIVLEGRGLVLLVDAEKYLDAVEEHITGDVRPVEPGRVLATLLFTDIVASTRRAAELGDRRWKVLLDDHDGIVRRQLERFRGKEINTTGDGFVASFDGPGRAIQCGCAIRDAVGTLGIEIRAGLHTGEIDMRGDDVAGVAVHTGARVGMLARAGEVLVSSTVKDLVAGSGIEFEDRGEHELKGVPGTWKLFAVKG